jgi:PhnB protein
MTTTQRAAAATPPITPQLVCAGAAEAIAFYARALGAEETMRLPGPDGRLVHAALTVNGAPVMLMDEFPEMGATAPDRLGGSPVTIHLAVDDADAWFARATAAGATVVMPLADQFWGDRYGCVRDPFGHLWSFGQPLRAMSAEEIEQAMRATAPAEAGATVGAPAGAAADP